MLVPSSALVTNELFANEALYLSHISSVGDLSLPLRVTTDNGCQYTCTHTHIPDTINNRHNV